MYLAEIKIWNFRKYGMKGNDFENAEPGVIIPLNPGLNVIIGENDSGKTAIVDAIRYILGTQSREWIRLDESDFHNNGTTRAEKFKIECIFRGFTNKEAAPEISYEEEHSGNFYKAKNGIEIEVGTVHSVKGQTHTATLLMETYYNGKVESQYLIDFLKGNYPLALLEKARHIECLKVTHVAFSRPTHLLTFACHENNIKDHHNELKKNGWIICRA